MGIKHKMLPIGLDSFDKLRKHDFYYVDKTLLIRDILLGWSEVNLFMRPRRFGKTLNMSMLKSFFEIGCDASVFEGLNISRERELCDAHMGKYPVVFLSLKDVGGLSFESAYQMLRGVIREEALRLYLLKGSERVTGEAKAAYMRILHEDDTRADIVNSLRVYSKLLCEHYGRKAILLIDEYDVPLDKAFEHGYYAEMLEVIRAMFAQALKSNESLHFAVLTGCLRVSKESLFTGLNNMKVYSILDAHFDEYFGFTRAEVERMLEYYGKPERMSDAREWYDGYRFGDEHIYCPWDVINYCHDIIHTKHTWPKAYWINTSGNAIVRRLIDKASAASVQHDIESLIAGEAIRKRVNTYLSHNEIDMSVENLWGVMLMTGYLTFTDNLNDDELSLVIPNKEVREIYIDQIRLWVKDNARGNKAGLSEFFQALEAGDAAVVERILNELLVTTISYFDGYETFYHGFMLALVSVCDNWVVSSNTETGGGRADILIEHRNRRLGIVIELKHAKLLCGLEAACSSALEQIEYNDYASVFRRDRVAGVLAYGIAFAGKECKVNVKRLN